MNYTHGIAILGTVIVVGCFVLGFLIYSEWRDGTKRRERAEFNLKHRRRKADWKLDAQPGDLFHFLCSNCGATSHSKLANLAEMPLCSKCGSVIEPVGFTSL